MNSSFPRVLIVGGGFGGLAAAKALRKTSAEIVLIDRNNHHVFQPLLYQVATSVLTPGQIAAPIRAILRKQHNATVILGEVTGVDRDRSCVIVNSVDRANVLIKYDYLILATGAGPSYFGHDEFAKFAPGLKTLADAVALRNKILQAFEQAEPEEDPSRHKNLLTFVLVGGGPTGVEMAGAIAVLVRTALRSDFRRIDPTTARIILVDRGSRVLGTFSEHLKEIWTHLLAYNLIRTMISQAATLHGIEPRTISFKGAIQTLEAFQPLFAVQGDRDWAHRRNLYQQFLDAIATHRVADRPNRFEPRLRKRRPKKYDSMLEPRHVIKRKMLKRVR